MRIKRMVLAALTATGITTAMTVTAVLPAQAAPASDPTLCGCGDKPPFAVGTDSAGTDFVFYGGADGGLWEKYSGNWNPSEIVKPPIGDADGDGNVAQPAVAVHPNGNEDVFWQGTNSPDLYEVSYVYGSGWGKVQNLGGPGSGNYNFDGLTAGSDSNGNDYLFWNNDGQLWEKWHYSNGWHGPALIYNPPAGSLAGITNGPTVAVHPNGQQDVFWEGSSPAGSAVTDTYDDSYANGAWSGPKSLGALSSSGLDTWPTAGADANNDVFLFWLDDISPGGLHEWWQIGSTRYGGAGYALPVTASQYGGPATGPAVAVHSSTATDVFWWAEFGGPPMLMEYSYSGGAWHTPVSRGGF